MMGSLIPHIVIWPLLLAGMLQTPRLRTLALRLSPWATFPALLTALFASHHEVIKLPWLLLGSEWGMDLTGRALLLLTGLLWGLACWHSRYHLPPTQQASFFSWFHLALAGNIGLIVSLDMLSFYLFFTLMSLASYGLVVHTRSERACYAGKCYLIFVILGEAALFAALLLVASTCSTLSFEAARPLLVQSEWLDTILLLAWIGFGIKVGTIGLHVWLPLAHPVAPPPASAVLSGIMLKAGLLGWLRLLPLGEATLESWGEWWMVLGLLAAFCAVLIGLTQRDAKTLLAYSSISQMGLLTAAVGLGLILPHAWPQILTTILIYSLHHGFAKGALFLGTSMLMHAHPISRKWLLAGVALPALSLVGAPLTSGWLAKSLLKTQAMHAPDHWEILWQNLLPASAIATALLMARFMLLAIRMKPDETLPIPAHIHSVPWAILLLLVAIMPLATNWLGDFEISLSLIINSLWPLMFAGLLFHFFYRQAIRDTPLNQRIANLAIPPGDMLAWYEHSIRITSARLHHLLDRKLPCWLQKTRHMLLRKLDLSAWSAHLDRAEKLLCHWPVALCGLILLGIILTRLIPLANQKLI